MPPVLRSRPGLARPLLVLALLLVSASPVVAADAHADECTDAGPPTVTSRSPQGRTLDFNPEVLVQYRDDCAVDPASVTLWLDGRRVETNATARGVSFVPPAALEAGPHVARVSVADHAGQRVNASWEFLVLPNALPGERHFVRVPPASPSDRLVHAPFVDEDLHLAGAWVKPTPGSVNLTLTVTRLATLPPDVTAPPADPLVLVDVSSRARFGTDTPVFAPGVESAILQVRLPAPLLSVRDAELAQVQLLHFEDGAWRALEKTGAFRNATHAGFNVTTPTLSPFALVIDTQPPDVHALAPADGVSLRSSPVIRASVRDQVGVALTQVVVDGSIANTLRRDPDRVIAQPTEDLRLVDGWHTVLVHAQDASGNNASATWSFILDREPPAFPRVTTHVDPETRHARLHVDWVDGVTGVDAATARVLLDGEDATALAEATTEGLTLVTSRALGPGTHTATVSVSDRAGNTGDVTESFTVPADTPGAGAAFALAALAALAAFTRARRRA